MIVEDLRKVQLCLKVISVVVQTLNASEGLHHYGGNDATASFQAQ